MLLRVLHCIHPGSGGVSLVKVKTTCIDELTHWNVTVDCLDNNGVLLKSAHKCLELVELLRGYQVSLVEHQRRAELNLLNKQVLDIVFFNIRVEKIGAVVELLKHASTVNNCDDVIKVEVRVISCMLTLIAECRNVIGNGDWLADARSLNNDVVKLLGIGQITQLKC